VESTLPDDIATASYYELVAWAQRLGLDESGSLEDLRRRLYNHYRVSAPEAIEEPLRVIVIQSARATEYLTIEGAGEDYLILTGKVRVEFQDGPNRVVHRIAAERIVVNETQRTLSASGGVSYDLLREDGSPERFAGDAFTFDIDEWDGLIIDGRGRTEREVEEGQMVTFLFQGQTIVRRPGDTVILQEGTVTSSLADDPYWHIRASRIWVLAPGEWAIRNAVLHVGRVPLFYIPFFFRPGDEIVFHPAVGYRPREGTFIQTTTYFVGEREREPSTLSFMRLTDEEDEGYELTRDGLFLRRVETEEPTEKTDDVLKLLVDYYSRLGFFGGIVADFDPLWSLRGGLGRSRTLYPVGTAGYSPFPQTKGATRSDWNGTEIGRTTLPFRFGVESALNLTGEAGRLSVDADTFSDPFFPEDFYRRAERTNFTALIAQQEQEDVPIADTGLDPTVRNNISWSVSSSLRTEPDWGWLESAQITRGDFFLYWQGQEREDTEATDPMREYFAPTRLVWPDLKMQFTGVFLELGGSTAEREAASSGAGEEPGRGFREPGTPALPHIDPEDPDLKTPEPRPELDGLDLSRVPDSFTLGYTLEPALLLESQYSDYSRLYSTMDLSTAHTIKANARFRDETVGIESRTIFDGTYQTPFDRTGAFEGDWDALEAKSLQATGFTLREEVDTFWLPLTSVPNLATSRVFHELGWEFYEYDWEEPADGSAVFSGSGPSWTREKVDENKIGERLTYKPGDIAHYLEVTADLPPLYGNYQGEADFTTGPLNSRVEGGYAYDGSQWLYDTLEITETFDPDSWMWARAKSDFELNEPEMERIDTTLRLFPFETAGSGWLLEQQTRIEKRVQQVDLSKTTLSAYGFTAYYQAEWLQPVRVVGTGYLAKGEEQLIPFRAFLGYELRNKEYYFWRNRIRVEPVVSSALNLELRQFTDSNLEVTTGFDLSIHRFADVGLSVTSYNDNIYRYYRPWTEKTGDPWISPLDDLLRSYRFLRRSDREESSFKLRSISISVVHDLRDWQLTFDYTGTQELNEEGNEYEWTPTFTIVVEWVPIPEIRRQVSKDEEGLSLRR
jgi:hypothetical protein